MSKATITELAPAASKSMQTLDDLLIRSKNPSSITHLRPLARSLLFAELSMIAYLPEPEVIKAAHILGFDNVIYYDRDGSQAYSFINETDHVIACRGTEPNEWNDVRADLDAATAVAETIGRVHRGFKREVDDIWPILEQSLKSNDKTLWFTGHSLGGAMATICAGRCMLSHIKSNPTQIYTFGSPRVGDKRYINFVKVDHVRWVHNNDIVPKVPPAWLGYRHTGDEHYLDSEGKLRKLNLIQRRKDAWKGFVSGIKNRSIDHFEDHIIDRYVDHIYFEALSSGDLDPK
ncbi:lipase family protein [Leucothrix pacifica]|uniref:Lipase n=1 Tax=Leucothrix pacifica TaxID=1247513 RepID=A0A317CM31_9GAMM|nr:lipase family protein [Leucothrix pacifica]PWQ99281.1 lipase [Leucothrix pacifica]